VHIGFLFSGLVAQRELSFLRTSPDSIYYARVHLDPALRNSRQAGPRFIAFAQQETGRPLGARSR
jgi:hypothetical protein